MEIYVTDNSIGRYFRSRQLGLRMLSHDARPRTVRQWSGLTKDELATLRGRWAIDGKGRRRGPSPSSFQIFFRSAHIHSYASLLVSLCERVKAIPVKRSKATADALPCIENGERLCEALEVLREWEPRAEFDFESASLLALGVVRGEEIDLTNCQKCNAATLIDKLGAHEPWCLRCQPEGRFRHSRRSV